MVAGTHGRRRKSCDQRNTCAVRENWRICCSFTVAHSVAGSLSFFFPLSFFTSRPERLRFRDLRFVGGRRRGFPGTGSATLYRPHRRNLSITIAVCCRRSTVTPRHGDQFTERPLGPTSFTSLPSSPRIIHVPCKHMYVYIYIYMSAVRACLYRSNLPSSSRNAL